MTAEKINPKNIQIITGSSNPRLALEIADQLGVQLSRAEITRFSNDNISVKINTSLQSRIVFIIQSLSPPVNDHLLELLLMLDIARGAAASKVIAIIPYYSFARSDKREESGISITARLIADLIHKAGATHVITMTLHSPQVHGFFSLPTDHLSSRDVFRDYFQGRDLVDSLLVAGDFGFMKQTALLAQDLKLPISAGNKKRISDKKVLINNVVGLRIKDYRRALIYDDEIATGGTMEELSNYLIREGMSEIWLACTHGVFVGDCLERLVSIPEISEIVTTNTIHSSDEKRYHKLHKLSVAKLFGDAIKRNFLQM